MTHFQILLDKAVHEANLAGDKWVAEHTKPTVVFYAADLAGNPINNERDYALDVCGGAYIELSDKRTKFAKFIKSLESRHAWSVSINHKYRGRQEMGLNEACIKAAFDTLKAFGVTGIRFKSYID